MGDIVANKTEQYDKWVVHRVTEKKVSDGKTIALMTKGDNNDLPDNQGVTADTYKFKVIWSTNFFVPITTLLFGTLTSFKIRLMKVMFAVCFILFTGMIAGKRFWVIVNQILKGVKRYENRKFTN